jgi:hypothetical protein
VFEVLIAYISLLQWQPGVAKIFVPNDLIIKKKKKQNIMP